MPFQVDAVDVNGVLRPLQLLDLQEHEHVLVSVIKDAAHDRPSVAVEYIEKVKRELLTPRRALVSTTSGGGLPRFPDRWPLKSLLIAGSAVRNMVRCPLVS